MNAIAYGSVGLPDQGRRVGARHGARVLDLAGLARRHGLAWAHLVEAPVLNPLLAAGRPVWERVHSDVTTFLATVTDDDELLHDSFELYLPFEVADYVDFYSSEHHATNVGRIFRPGADALPRNWKHLPLGYHGRAGTVVVSGTPVIRPCGQRLEAGADAPTYGPSQRLDIEAEVGFVVGVGTTLGQRVAVDAFADHVFGVVLVNDWSARDLQAWEYVPLGPFLGKSFATSVSPWVVPLSVLEHARVVPPARDVPVLPYLVSAQNWGLDIEIEVRLNGHVISRPRYATMYWTADQQLAHLTVNGASLRTGDLFASGTVSDETHFGSLLELTWNGAHPVAGDRTFLLDDDEVVLTASAPGPNGTRVEFGEVRGTIRAAHEWRAVVREYDPRD